MGSSSLVLGLIRMQKIKMIRVPLMIFCLNTFSNAVPQGINFGGSSSNSNKEISNRNNQQNTNNKHFNSNSNNCCCIPEGNSCFNSQNGGDDLVGQGFIDERIVNRPNSGSNQGLTQSCPYRHKICCYPDNYDFSVFGRTCVPPTTGGSSSGFTSGSSAAWRQGCSESSVYGSNQCGTRTYGRPVSNLKKIGFNEIVKVRVGEYDASGFNSPEKQKHEEYEVSRIIKHPQFDPKRLSNDIAILRVNRRINLNHPYVNTACLPSCDNQFDYQFSNGTGVRCWVAGWGKNEYDGSFQFIQHKVDVPIVDDYKCNLALKRALNRKEQGVGDRFQLHQSEVCAGTETGKDACTGDGGSPLVCQAQSGRWTVVGLVAWGIGCGSHVPGVYTNVHHYKQWINSIN